MGSNTPILLKLTNQLATTIYILKNRNVLLDLEMKFSRCRGFKSIYR